MPVFSRLSSFAAKGLGNSVASFKGVTFRHTHKGGNLLESVDFSIRESSKVTIMGQNGSGKSTIIKLLTKSLEPDEGRVVIAPGMTLACALQTMPITYRDLTIKDFFRAQFKHTTCSPADHDLEARISKVLNLVHLDAPGERIIKSFSGGQQARLLLAAALIQDPSILLLDEPTNNLDVEGLRFLQKLIQETDKTCVVISHDEDFLNSFSDTVLYLDVHSKKVEMYPGNYFLVKQEISNRIERENAKNHQLTRVKQIFSCIYCRTFAIQNLISCNRPQKKKRKWR